MLRWAAGGAVALAGGGAATARLLRDRDAGAAPRRDLTDRTRLLDTSTVATPRWKTPVTAPPAPGGRRSRRGDRRRHRHQQPLGLRPERPSPLGPLSSNPDRSTFGVGGASAAVGDGTLFAIDRAGFAGHGVKAVDLATGSVARTATRPQTQIAMAWAPGILGGLVYVTGMFYADGQVYVWAKGQVWALSEKDGAARWTYRFGDSGEPLAPAAFWAVGGLVYGPGEGGLVAVQAAPGRDPSEKGS